MFNYELNPERQLDFLNRRNVIETVIPKLKIKSLFGCDNLFF